MMQRMRAKKVHQILIRIPAPPIGAHYRGGKLQILLPDDRYVPVLLPYAWKGGQVFNEALQACPETPSVSAGSSQTYRVLTVAPLADNPNRYRIGAGDVVLPVGIKVDPAAVLTPDPLYTPKHDTDEDGDGDVDLNEDEDED